jgi:hypothetical protein
MGDKTWKAFERWVGEHIFGGAKRNIGSGKINSCDDGTPRAGDVIHPTFCIECKCYKAIAIFRWWDKLKEEALASKKIPVLIMKEVGDTQDTLVCMHWKDFVRFKEAAEKEGVIQ